MDHADAARSIKNMSELTIELLACLKYSEAVVTLKAIAARSDALLTIDKPGRKEKS